MTSLRSVLAFNIKEQRLILGISQSKLAERVNTSTHYIGMIESEKKFPTPEMLERIATALEIEFKKTAFTRNISDFTLKLVIIPYYYTRVVIFSAFRYKLSGL